MKDRGYLLDTNIISDFIKKPQGKAAQKIREVGNNNIFTSIIVASELRFGVRKKASKELSERVEKVLDVIEIINFTPPSDTHYAEVRAYLEKAGTPIDPNDLLIASHALAEGLTMVTGNIREFERVPDLKVENWL